MDASVIPGANGIAAFRDYIASLGFEAPARIDPGRWMSFSTNGKNGDSAGRAKLFPDLEGGVVWDHRSGESWTWQAKIERPRTEPELRAWRDKCERSKREAEAERAREILETAERARKHWQAAQPADDSHPYLKAKDIKAHGARIYRGSLALNGLRCDGALMLPARNAEGETVSLAFIAASGDKRYLNGPRPPGAYFSIGKPNGTICVAEGYATGASIHAATGHAAGIAFDAGNLEATARALRSKFPDARMILCADNDVGEGVNRGIEDATKAARAVGGLLAIPEMGGAKCDFNDLARSKGGPDAVRAAIDNARAPEVSQAQPIAPNTTERALDGVQITRGDSIKPEPVTWLWNGYLAAGKLHVMAGAPGTGKTTLAIGLVATLTSGGRWPDGTRATAAAALIWSGEDSPADTLIPRLIAAGAKLDRVHFVGDMKTADGSRAFDPAEDFAALELEAARIPGLRLVIVDPIVSAVAGDSHKNAEVRRGLQPLVRFAERTGCAVMGISHFSKGTAGRDPVERVTGSIAFGALARVVLATAKVPDEEGGGRIMVRAKCNIGPDGGGFKYELRVVELPGSGIVTTRPEWCGTVEGTAREILATAEIQGDPDEKSATGEAGELLREILANGAPVEVQEARRKLKAEGFTDKQIRVARERLGIKRARDGFGGKDFWTLPASRSCPVHAVHALSNCVGINGHERGGEGINGGTPGGDEAPHTAPESEVL